MKTIRRYDNAADAGFDQSLIEEAGLKAIIIEDLGVRPGSRVASPGLLLQVEEADADRALEILGPLEGSDSGAVAEEPASDDGSLVSPASAEAEPLLVTCPGCKAEWELTPAEGMQKRFVCTQCSNSFPIINISAIQGGWLDSGAYPQPDWKLISGYIKQCFSPEEQPELWRRAAMQWVRGIGAVAGPQYRVYESKNFVVLTARPPDSAKLFLGACENALVQLRELLGALGWRWTDGKHVVLMFEDLDLYNGYVAYFDSERDAFTWWPGTSLNRGYCHIALAPCRHPVAVVVHQLARLALVSWGLPRWLGEGLAINTEETVNRKKTIQWNSELAASHKAHWNRDTIQDFWTGKSFMDSETSQVSYSLAQILVSNMREDFGNLEEFIKNADYADAGEASAFAHLGATLSEIASTFLGPGDWGPRGTVGA